MHAAVISGVGAVIHTIRDGSARLQAAVAVATDLLVVASQIEKGSIWLESMLALLVLCGRTEREGPKREHADSSDEAFPNCATTAKFGRPTQRRGRTAFID